MPLQTNGPISISDIATEFDVALPTSIGQLANTAGIGGLPKSLTDFYGLSAGPLIEQGATSWTPVLESDANILAFPFHIFNRENDDELFVINPTAAFLNEDGTQTLRTGSVAVERRSPETDNIEPVFSISCPDPRENGQFGGDFSRRDNGMSFNARGDVLFIPEFTQISTGPDPRLHVLSRNSEGTYDSDAIIDINLQGQVADPKTTDVCSSIRANATGDRVVCSIRRNGKGGTGGGFIVFDKINGVWSQQFIAYESDFVQTGAAEEINKMVINEDGTKLLLSSAQTNRTDNRVYYFEDTTGNNNWVLRSQTTASILSEFLILEAKPDFSVIVSGRIGAVGQNTDSRIISYRIGTNNQLQQIQAITPIFSVNGTPTYYRTLTVKANRDMSSIFTGMSLTNGNGVFHRLIRVNSNGTFTVVTTFDNSEVTNPETGSLSTSNAFGGFGRACRYVFSVTNGSGKGSTTTEVFFKD